jgi:hypothetical protein
MFRILTNKSYNECFKSIEQILNVLFKYKPKTNVGLLRHSRMTFSFGVPNPIKKSNYVLLFSPVSPILSKPLECKIVIIKINLIVPINAYFLMKNSKTLTLIPQNLVIYHTKNLCHHIEHILLYLWLKYGTI